MSAFVASLGSSPGLVQQKYRGQNKAMSFLTLCQIQSSKDKTSVKQHVITVVALVTTMGLAWIFGFLMLVSDNHGFLQAMSWLFTIVNAFQVSESLLPPFDSNDHRIYFQGVVIFYFTAVRSGELVRICTQTKSRLYSAPTASTGVSSNVTQTTT